MRLDPFPEQGAGKVLGNLAYDLQVVGFALFGPGAERPVEKLVIGLPYMNVPPFRV
jgi:hypothetical protein